MLWHRIEKSFTPSSGAWSANTLKLRGIIKHIWIKPASADTTFDFSMTDDGNRKVVEYLTEEGLLDDRCSIPAQGVYTMAIANASADEPFELMIMVGE